MLGWRRNDKEKASPYPHYNQVTKGSCQVNTDKQNKSRYILVAIFDSERCNYKEDLKPVLSNNTHSPLQKQLLTTSFVLAF